MRFEEFGSFEESVSYRDVIHCSSFRIDWPHDLQDLDAVWEELAVVPGYLDARENPRPQVSVLKAAEKQSPRRTPTAPETVSAEEGERGRTRTSKTSMPTEHILDIRIMIPKTEEEAWNQM